MKLSEAYIEKEVRPQFSRVLARDEVYLANHSLGRPPDRAAEYVKRAMDLWYERMDWNWYLDDGWLAETDKWRANTAKLIGLPKHDCIVPKVSAGQGLRAVLNALIGKKKINVVTTTGEFDSIDFILRTYAMRGVADVRFVEPSDCDGPVPIYVARDIADAIDDDTDLVVFSRVFYTTAQILDGFEEIVTKAHKHGALVLADLFHAAGVIPFNMEQEGYDFAIGGSYKYLRGGPGACWLAIHPATFEKGLRSLDTGWFAKADHFGFHRGGGLEFKPRGDGWLESTPIVLAPYQAMAGLEFVLETGVDNLREQSLQSQETIRDVFKSYGLSLYRPSDPTRFGGFTLFPHPDAAALWKRLSSNGVNVDARLGFVRFGPDVLNTKAEFEKAARTVKSQL
ncbi:MAG TPA: aminotransferase class V-fold PLP-dependent enzyme [Fimbriimonadaceae bacterium]|nr:aminotransferase class V-fold PLP-dependent enzyme [Fimbriimonadaceae bacterium]